MYTPDPRPSDLVKDELPPTKNVILSPLPKTDTYHTPPYCADTTPKPHRIAKTLHKTLSYDTLHKHNTQNHHPKPPDDINKFNRLTKKVK